MASTEQTFTTTLTSSQQSLNRGDTAKLHLKITNNTSESIEILELFYILSKKLNINPFSFICENKDYSPITMAILRPTYTTEYEDDYRISIDLMGFERIGAHESLTVSFDVSAIDDSIGDAKIFCQTTTEDPPLEYTQNTIFIPIINLDLDIIKTVSKTLAYCNDLLHYTFTIENIGNLDILLIDVIDTLDDKINYILDSAEILVDGSSKGLTISKNDTTNEFKFALSETTILAPSKIAELTFDVRVKNNTVGDIVNIATINYSDSSSQNFYSKPSNATLTPIANCDSSSSIALSKTASKTNVKPDEIFSYTIVINNTSKDPLTLEYVVESLDNDLTYIENSAIVSINNTTSTLTLATSPDFKLDFPDNYLLDINEVAIVTFKVKVDTALEKEFISFSNVKFAEHSDLYSTNTVLTRVKFIELTISKSATTSPDSNSINCDDTMTYTLTITNPTEVPAINVYITDYFDRGFVFDRPIKYSSSKDLETIKEADSVEYLDPNGIKILINQIDAKETITINITGKFKCC